MKLLKKVKLKTIGECIIKGIYIGSSVWLDVMSSLLSTMSIFVALYLCERSNPYVRDIAVMHDFFVTYQVSLFINLLRLAALIFFLYTAMKSINGEDAFLGGRPVYMLISRIIIGTLLFTHLYFLYNKGESFLHKFLTEGDLLKVIILLPVIYFLYYSTKKIIVVSFRGQLPKMITVRDYLSAFHKDTLVQFIDGNICEGAYTVREILESGNSLFLNRIVIPECVTVRVDDAVSYVAPDCWIYDSLDNNEVVTIMIIDFTSKDLNRTDSDRPAAGR